MLYIMQENYLKTVADRNNNDAEAQGIRAGPDLQVE